MKAVIQRVSSSSVSIAGGVHNSISMGYMILLGICTDDGNEDIQWLAKKIINLRVFSDEDGLMNKNILQVDGQILLISQFTLYAKTRKGNRPSFIDAAKPDIAIPLYEQFINELKKDVAVVKKGVFGGDMQVSLVNDGPVTIIIDSKNRI